MHRRQLASIGFYLLRACVGVAPAIPREPKSLGEFEATLPASLSTERESPPKRLRGPMADRANIIGGDDALIDAGPDLLIAPPRRSRNIFNLAHRNRRHLRTVYQVISLRSTRMGGKEPWHAVSIVCGPVGCSHAVDLRDRRYLATEAPRLPLRDCSSPWRCTCTYKHFPDRRWGPRRETERGRFPRPRKGPERRLVPGRRCTDME